MKLPASILLRVRGPILAAALAGCSSPAAAPPSEVEPEPEPAAVAEVPPAPDPVAYDLDAETERLERTDRLLAAAETRRAHRIEAEEQAARQRRIERALFGGVGAIGTNNDWIMAACGRG